MTILLLHNDLYQVMILVVHKDFPTHKHFSDTYQICYNMTILLQRNDFNST